MKYIFPDNSGFIIPPTEEHQNMPFFKSDDNIINDIDDTARQNDYIEYLYLWRRGYTDTPIEHEKIYVKNKKDDVYYYYDIRVDWFYYGDPDKDDFLDTPTRYVSLNTNGRSKITNNPKTDVSKMLRSAIKNSLDKFKDFLVTKFIILPYEKKSIHEEYVTRDVYLMAIRNYIVTTVYMSDGYNNNLYDYFPENKEQTLELGSIDIKKIDTIIKRYNKNIDNIANKFGITTDIIDLIHNLEDKHIKIIRQLSKLQLERIKIISDVELHSIRFLKNDDIKIIRDVTWKLKQIVRHIHL